MCENENFLQRESTCCSKNRIFNVVHVLDHERFQKLHKNAKLDDLIVVNNQNLETLAPQKCFHCNYVNIEKRNVTNKSLNLNVS